MIPDDSAANTRALAKAGARPATHTRPPSRQLRDGAVASAVTAIAGKSAAPRCHANGSAVVLALEAIRCDLQADLAVALVA